MRGMAPGAERRLAVLALAGLVLSACVAYWAASGDQTAQVTRHLVVWACACAAYLAALWAARGLSPRGLALALGLATLWRLVLVPAPPLLSDDVYRSVWEGRIQLHGGNPYAWDERPEAERWRGLRDETWARMNQRGYAAVYPPLWQLAARAVVAIHDSPAAIKAFLVCCEALALWALGAACVLRGQPLERLLVWAWSPLAVVEIAGSGHNEPLALLFVALALWALEARQPGAAALLAALGAQSKLLPALFAAAWLRRFRAWHLAGAAALGAVLVWPFAGAGADLWRSLLAYGRSWLFNETVFAAFLALAGTQARASLIGLAALAVLAALLALWRVEPVAAGLCLASAWLLLSANVLPWYALWLLPWLVLRDQPGALAFTLTCGLAYLVYPQWLAGGAWQVSPWVRLCEYAPALLLGLSAFGRGRAAASAAP